MSVKITHVCDECGFERTHPFEFSVAGTEKHAPVAFSACTAACMAALYRKRAELLAPEHEGTKKPFKLKDQP
jgi:hypothetical protein